MLTKLGCPLHNQEPLDFACLAQNCDTRGLICYLCKLSQHHQHAPIVSLKMFVHSFLGSRASNECFIRQAAQIDEELLRILHKITKLKNRFHDFNIVEQTYHRFWKETVDQITEYDSILNELETLIAEKNDQQLKMLNTWILKHCHMYQTEKEEEQNENVYLAYLKNKHTAIVKISESIHKFEEKANFEDTDLLSLFKNEKAEHKLKLRFSDSLKGTCMSIQSATRASMTTSGNQRMMLLEPALSNNRALKRWKVKIEKMASWIGVGVGHLDSIKAVNFDFSYTNANHGNYLISSNGYSWNGYKMEFNSKFEPFTFTTGDTIMVIYDPANNKVTFQKEGHDQVFSYDVDPNQKPIHAAINMTGIGDCVQIVT